MKRVMIVFITVLISGFMMLAGSGENLVQFITEVGADAAWFGVKIRNLNAEELRAIATMEDVGVYVDEVSENSPAEKAGLRQGDILIRLAGIPILGASHFTSLIRSSSPGRTFNLEYLRGNSPEKTKVTLGRNTDSLWSSRSLPSVQIPEVPLGRSFNFFPSAGRPRLGIYYEDLTEQLGDFLGVEGGKGVLITSVVEDSPAEEAGLQAGDVIVSIDAVPVEDSGDLLAALERTKSEESFEVRIIRRGKTQAVTIRTEPQPGPKRRGLSI